jgi:hypothetical protein
MTEDSGEVRSCENAISAPSTSSQKINIGCIKPS